MNKTITSGLFVLALAFGARAEVSVTNDFTTGTSFENRPLGMFDAAKDDSGDVSGPRYWLPETVVTDAVVTAYAPGEAYDYAAHGTVRNALFNDEPATSPGENKQYLSFELDEPLDRTILPHEGGVVTNVPVKTSAYDGIYADALVRFLPSPNGPEITEDDRAVVWMREAADAVGNVVTNLMITAGRYDGSFKKVVCADYVLTNVVTAGAWCRMTIRAISDVTEYLGGAGIAERAPGVAVYLDGQPAAADQDYDIGTVARRDSLSPASRVLIAERRLFPSLAKAATTRAMTLSRLSLAGSGAVDDVLFTTERPEFVTLDNVFTLHWDAGVVSDRMLCIVSNATGVVTNEIDATQMPRYRDFALGTNHYAQVTVTNVVYDAVRGYTNGLWFAESDCTVAGNVFTYDGPGANPVGYVASSRDVVSVGGGSGCETFAEAKKLARAKGGLQTIVLEADLVISCTNKSSGLAYYDKGYFPVNDGEDLILDLKGHTLTGNGDVATVTQSGGRLRITDSSDGKTGRIVPSAKAAGCVAVSVCPYQNAIPTNVIDAGVYDGAVVITNQRGHVAMPVGIIEGGTFTNLYGAAGGFYLEPFVTNATAYYGIDASNCWSIVTNGFVWCGRGDGSRWDDAANWRGRAVPGAGDLAIFPQASTPWAVDFGSGADAKDFWIDGDVALAGTNVFSDVTVVSGEGRLVGTGTAVFINALPGKLTGEIAHDGEIRLGADWLGTVKIGGIGTAQVLTDVESWGLAGSKVEFAGVRGYLSDRKDHALPYELVLTDVGATPAWKNETGYTGSTVSFPRLSGSGTFDSPENLREVMQVYRFADVADFAGAFRMGGKRLALGEGASAAGSGVGYVTFADGVRVRTGKDNGWTAVSARFGKTLRVSGETNDVLMSFTGSVPAVGGVTVLRTRTDGVTVTNWLEAVGGQVIVRGEKPPAQAMMMLDARPIYATAAGSEAKSGSTLSVLPGSAVSIVDNRILVNGRVVVSTIADYYSVSGDADTGYSVAFNEPEVQPEVADFRVTEGAGGIVEIVVDNARAGLWYGVETRASLAAADWTPPETWTQAEADGELYLPAPKTGDAGSFYRVLVTDKEP